MSLLYFRFPGKEDPFPNGPFISKSQTKIRNVYLSVISEFHLSFLSLYEAYLQPIYTSLCRGLKYLPKISYFIQDYHNWARLSRLFFRSGQKQCPMSENTLQKCLASLVTYPHLTFIECMSKKYICILIYRYARYANYGRPLGVISSIVYFYTLLTTIYV